MASQVVKRQILLSVECLNIPLDRVPSRQKVADACAAAKLLRNRLLREHSRVTAAIEKIRQASLYNDVASDDDDDMEGDSNGNVTTRADFEFISEMMTAEKIVVPLLLAHGMRFSDTLLPQLLKLLAALLLPAPRFSANESHQKDLLGRMKQRCGTDEFFAFIVQCVAPIAEKRTTGSLERSDMVLLEIILQLISSLLDAPAANAENIIGAFCRNHGIELLLVVVSQNYAKLESKNAPTEVDDTTVETQAAQSTENVSASGQQEDGDKLSNAVDEIELDDEEDDGDHAHENEDHPNEFLLSHNVEMDREFNKRYLEMLENEDQLWKLNSLITRAISSVLTFCSIEELAYLSFVENSAEGASQQQLLNVLRNKDQFRDCRRERENWRMVARSRNGATNSNGILIRPAALSSNSHAGADFGAKAIGSVSAFYGTRRKDPLAQLKEIDTRKRGRYVKGMYQGNTQRCNLPLPTMIQLSRQCQMFLSSGFEVLNSMMRQKNKDIIAEVSRASKEYEEMVTGLRQSGDTLEITSPLTPELHTAFQVVLATMSTCSALLQYLREVVRLFVEKGTSSAAQFQQLWQSVASIVSLDHLESGFEALRAFLRCRDIRKRCDINIPVQYLTEILLVLKLLIDGDVIKDPAVEVAAHALASSVLYREENIRTLFDLLLDYSTRKVKSTMFQSATLFTYAIFFLIEKCSFQGKLLLPKRRNKKSGKLTDDVDNEEDDNASVDSADMVEEYARMEEEMKDMIADTDEESDTNEEDNKKNEKEDRADQDDHELPTLTASELALPSPSAAAPENSEVERNDAESDSQVPLSEVVARSLRSELDGTSSSQRAASVVSVETSGGLSAVSSEREVAVGSYLRRLASARNAVVILNALQMWRVNSADLNHGITFLMRSLAEAGFYHIFFHIGFLIAMRDVLVYGEETHTPLYDVCDDITHLFFNPAFALRQDENMSEEEKRLFSGAQSCLGFEVSLRCARSLFSFSATDYAILEEKGMYSLETTALSLPGEDDGGETEDREAALYAELAADLDNGDLSDTTKELLLRRERRAAGGDEGNSDAAAFASLDANQSRKSKKDSKQRRKKRKVETSEGEVSAM